MERINEARLFWQILFRGTKKGRFAKILRLALSFYSWNIALCSDK